MAKEKSVEAYRSIGEVSEMLGVAAHVLRSWEKDFPQLSATKRVSGRRLYSKKEVELLEYIHREKHEKGSSTAEVKEQIKSKKFSLVSDDKTREKPQDSGVEVDFCRRIDSIREKLLLE